MITALAPAGEEFNADKLRYHKIIIMTDADVDGSPSEPCCCVFLPQMGQWWGAGRSTSSNRRDTA